MSFHPASQTLPSIPVLLLKTRSQPHDVYEEYFASSSAQSTQPSAGDSTAAVSQPSSTPFQAQCIPVLEHKQNEKTLNELEQLLSNGKFAQRYGGMIFTSQRAVEAWADTVGGVEKEEDAQVDAAGDLKNPSEAQGLNPSTKAHDSRTGEQFGTDIFACSTFPIFVVGPATSRAVLSLISSLPRTSTFARLRWSIQGADSGSGAVLAPFILRQYNSLHSQNWYTWHDAPRLPFIPLVGMGSENYSRRRLETDDPLLRKRPLLFLVGEQRRDIIPKTLMDEKLGDDKITVEEVEVYRTEVRHDFKADFEEIITSFANKTENPPVIVVVVFSPQGSGDMLHALGYLDDSGHVTAKAKRRWEHQRRRESEGASTPATTETDEPIFVIATIGPTTRDHLVDNFGFEPDVCAKKPSPEGVGDGIREFLTKKGLL